MTSFTYFEPLLDGHSTLWARTILEAAAKDPRFSNVNLVTNAQMAARLQETCKKHGIMPEILGQDAILGMTRGSLWSRARRQWTTAMAIRARTEGDVFLPFFDHAVVAAAMDRRNHSGTGKVSGVIFRPPNNFGRRPSLSRHLDELRRWSTYALARQKKIKSLFTLDEYAFRSKWSHWTGALQFLPDFAPDLHDLHSAPARPRDDQRKTWLLFGSLNRRKGIFQMLQAWAMMDPNFHKTNALRLVGKLHAEDEAPFLRDLKALRRSKPNIVVEVVNRFVSETELAQEVSAAKVILAPYQNHIGSSGVLYWAAAAGKPVLSQASGLMGFLVQHYGLGQVVETGNPAAIADMIGIDIIADIDQTFYQCHEKSVFTNVILNGVISE